MMEYSNIILPVSQNTILDLNNVMGEGCMATLVNYREALPHIDQTRLQYKEYVGGAMGEQFT